MSDRFASRVSRFFAALCLALALVNAGGAAAEGIKRAQHSLAEAAHQHTLIDEAGHHDAGDNDGQASEHIAPGHHHHADAGSGLLPIGADTPTELLFATAIHPPLDDRRVPRLHSSGPERPPRLAALNA